MINLFNRKPRTEEVIEAPVEPRIMGRQEWGEALAEGPRLVTFTSGTGTYAGVAMMLTSDRSRVYMRYYDRECGQWYKRYAEFSQLALLVGLTRAQETEACSHLLAGQRLPRALGILAVVAVNETAAALATA